MTFRFSFKFILPVFSSSLDADHHSSLWCTALQQPRLPGDLQLWSPEHLIPFDTVCHSGCNCHLLKAFKTIKSFSALGAWQYISALIRTLGCQRNCPPRANPAPWGAAPTKLIILCNHTSWNTATAAGKYRFGVKHYNVIPICDLLPAIPTEVDDLQYFSLLLS